MIGHQKYPKTWKQFGKEVRRAGCHLLKRLDEFQYSILVTGCQRSGTTMLSRVITKSDGMTNYWFGKDDELDAALILSGRVAHHPRGRYCFQTTYLNECYHEYYEKKNGHKLIWVLRNPLSVIHSMVYNWKRFALNELFSSCGLNMMNEQDRKAYNRFGELGISRLRRACFAYNGKIMQLFQIKQKLGLNAIKVIEYDELVTKKDEILPLIYKYVGLAYKPEYANLIHTKSLTKVSLLSAKQKKAIEEICLPIYEKALEQLDFTL